MTAHSKEWVASTSTKEDLDELVFDGVLPDQEITAWWPIIDEHYPTPNDGELVVFEDFYRRGFGLPAHPFFLQTPCVLWHISHPSQPK